MVFTFYNFLDSFNSVGLKNGALMRENRRKIRVFSMAGVFCTLIGFTTVVDPQKSADFREIFDVFLEF